MKILVAFLALLICASAFSHEGFKHRDRWTDEHGVPYGAQNPPVGVGPSAGAHCMYSAYGCSGAGGSTGPRGYAYGYQPYGAGYGGVYGPNGSCGSYQNRGGGAGIHNGNVAGNVYMNQSRGNCGPNGYNQQNLGGNVGIVNGRASGGVYFNESSTN